MGIMRIGLLVITFFLLLTNSVKAKEENPPNIIFILSDEFNWGDLGSYGQNKIRTPNLDRTAGEGMKFTHAYSGASVCAPSRSSLMQGLHQGHARVRGNSFRGYRESLQKGDFTVAMLLKKAGYKTGIFGKWGLALHNQPGIPGKMGFDEFFGYLNQQHAHTYYPEFLYHNEERVCFPENGEHHKFENYSKASSYDEEGKVLPNGIKDPSKAVYSFDIIAEKSLEFVRKNKDNPFFLYLPYTIPHGPLIVPDLGEYQDKDDWDIQHKEWAAMITRMDTEVGKLLNLLQELSLDENTIIFFASDNGNSSGYDGRYLKVNPDATPIMDFFHSYSPTRGGKGGSYDGAFRIPAIVRWSGHIGANLVSAQIWAFWDFMPTVAEIVGVEPPSGLDGISILPTLLGDGKQVQHEYLYWEDNQNQAVRYRRWFAHRANGGEVELYDLPADPQQSHDLSQRFPDIVKKIEQIMSIAHTPSEVWPGPGETPEEFNKRLSDNSIPERPDNAAEY